MLSILSLDPPPPPPPLSNLPQPKAFKEFWCVFRALDTGRKILDYYTNEAKFIETPAEYKGSIPLQPAVSVQAHNPDKRQQFCIECSDGVVHLFEASSIHDAEEWVLCMCAVLFGKNTSGGELAIIIARLLADDNYYYTYGKPKSLPLRCVVLCCQMCCVILGQVKLFCPELSFLDQTLLDFYYVTLLHWNRSWFHSCCVVFLESCLTQRNTSSSIEL